MSSKLTLPAIALLVFGGLAAASSGFAQNPPASPSQPQGQGQGMMGGSGNMGDMMNMMGQMNRMADNCNRMMETANGMMERPNKPAAPATPAPGQRG